VAGTRDRDRVREDVLRITHRGLGVGQLAREVARVLRRVVPFDGTCLLTMDPATLLPTGDFVDNGLPASAAVRLSEIELGEPDVNKFTALARAQQPAAGLAEATGGELDRSTRHRELRRPSGFDDELRVVLTGAAGTWGALTLLRENRRPHFTAADTRLMASLAAPLSDAVRRALLLAAAGGGEDTETGLLVLAPDLSVDSANRAADHWLDELGTGDREGRLPVAVRSVAVRARRIATGADAGGDGARARVRTPAGRWAMVQGSLLGDGPDARVAVLLQTARPPELAPLIAGGYRLTDRERRITELVAQGFSTSDIGARLHLSTYTVQDHLKSIFGKTGTGSRGELVARLFFDHYAPRLADRRR
jgi:DNA-binding CsgD family transcriptional regulator